MKLGHRPRGRISASKSLGADLRQRKAVCMYLCLRTGLEESVSGYVQNFAGPLVVGNGGLCFPEHPKGARECKTSSLEILSSVHRNLHLISDLMAEVLQLLPPTQI